MSEQKTEPSLDWFKDYPYFFNPWTSGAILLMALNDHYLKETFHNALTGKISDFAGLFYFPTLLMTLWRLFKGVLHKKASFSPISSQEIVATLLLTDFLFMLFKLSPFFSRALEGFFSQYLFSITITNDPTDLIALLSNLGTWWIFSRYQRK